MRTGRAETLVAERLDTTQTQTDSAYITCKLRKSKYTVMCAVVLTVFIYLSEKSYMKYTEKKTEKSNQRKHTHKTHSQSYI